MVKSGMETKSRRKIGLEGRIGLEKNELRRGHLDCLEYFS